jgi:hypothetical protein
MAGPYNAADANNYLGIGKQSAKGTGVAPTLWLPYLGTMSANHGMGGDDVREAGAGLYVARARKTKHDPEGAGAMNARPSTAGKLLAWFLGADTISGAGPYTHTLAPSATNTWLSIERNQSDEIIDRFVDAQLRKVVASGEAGGDLTIAFEYAALTAARQASATSESYEAVDPFQQDEATYTIDGSGATDVASWSVEMAWGLDEDVRLSKVTRDQLLKLNISATIKVKQLIAAETAYRTINYGSSGGSAPNKDFFSTGAFAVTYDNGLATTNNRQLTFSFAKVAWKEGKLSDLNPDGETVYLERTGIATKTTTTISVVAITGDSTGYLV